VECAPRQLSCSSGAGRLLHTEKGLHKERVFWYNTGMVLSEDTQQEDEEQPAGRGPAAAGLPKNTEGPPPGVDVTLPSPSSAPESMSQQREVVEAAVDNLTKESHAKIAAIMNMTPKEVARKLKGREAPAFREKVVETIIETNVQIGQLLHPIKNPAKYRMVVGRGKRRVKLPPMSEIVRNPNSDEARKLIAYFEMVANDHSLQWVLDNLMDDEQRQDLRMVIEMREQYDALAKDKSLHGIGVKIAGLRAKQRENQAESGRLRGEADATKVRAYSGELSSLRKETAESKAKIEALEDKKGELKSELEKIEQMVGSLKSVKTSVKFTDADLDSFGPKTIPDKLNKISLRFGPNRADTKAPLGAWISEGSRRRRSDVLLDHSRHAPLGKPLPADKLLADLIREHLHDPRNKELTDAGLEAVSSEVRERLGMADLPVGDAQAAEGAAAAGGGEGAGDMVDQAVEAAQALEAPEVSDKPSPIGKIRATTAGAAKKLLNFADPRILYRA